MGVAGEHQTAERWRSLVEEWRSSGLSRSAFARARGLNASTLGWWRWRLGIAMNQEPAFLDVVVTDRQERPPDLIVEVGALRVRVPAGFDSGEVRRLVEALC